MSATYNGIPADIVRDAAKIRNKLNFEESTFVLFIIATNRDNRRLAIWAGTHPQGMPDLKAAIDLYVGGALPDGEYDDLIFDD